MCVSFYRGRSRKNFEPAGDSNEVQKKFAGATAISSDQFFGPRDPDVSCHRMPETQDFVLIKRYVKSMKLGRTCIASDIFLKALSSL